VEEWWDELACCLSVLVRAAIERNTYTSVASLGTLHTHVSLTVSLPFISGRQPTIRELHLQFEQPSFPDRLVFARYRTVPSLQVESSLLRLHRPCDEAKRVVLSPILATMMSVRYRQTHLHEVLPLLRQPCHAQRAHVERLSLPSSG